MSAFIALLLLVGLSATVTTGCGERVPEMGASDEATALDPQEKAERLAREILIVDTHIDVAYRLTAEWEDISGPTEKGDFDYARAKAGGLDAPFMSIYVPASYQKNGSATEYADDLIDMVEGFEARWPDKFAIARSPAEVRRQVAAGRIALPMGMENGAPIEGDLANLRHFYERGIRYITLTHSENNHICDSSYATEARWNGLSPFGRQVVAEMNRLGIMIDVSHVSDEAFYQVLESTKAPVIASHSSCRYFTPGWERNLSDEMIRALAANGGVIQINFGSAFLREDAQKQSSVYWKAYEAYRDSAGLGPHQAAEEFEKQYWQDKQRIYADVSEVADHIDHVVELVGVDHVGFGSDFDGVGDSLPTGLKDVSHYPNLIRELLGRGYSEEEIRKIAGENLLRVWSEVERLARQLQSTS